jgi:plastocyanin
VRSTLINQDDEKHNLVNAQAGLPKSEAPDVGGGRTVSFTWTVPNRPGTYKFICTYHPWMVINVTIEK